MTNQDSFNHLLILYATETGNTQDAADTIARQCRRLSLRARILSIEDYPLPDLVSEELVIFVVSTTGSGQEPRSMTPFWHMLLRSDLPTDLFEDMTFAVFGLGDTAYEKFCWPAKKLSRRLLSLGAVELCERGEADDQHQLGIDGALVPWIETLLRALLGYLSLPPGMTDTQPSSAPPPRVRLTRIEATSDKNQPQIPSRESRYQAKVKCNTRITATDWFQDVRHLELDFDQDIQYSPGDVAVIYPIASSKDVDSFLQDMEWASGADDAYTMEHIMSDQTLPSNLPSVITFKELFTRHLDFNAVPKRSFFQYLRYFATDELEVERLDEFLSLEGADELYDYCFGVRRTIREVLMEFRHTKIPKDYIFDIFPPLRPRQFSIASSVKKHPRQIHLCIAIVKYRTKLKVPRRGVCTSYISRLEPGNELLIGIQRGFIRLPPDKNTPILCIGPGTGIAPMRSVIEERIHAGSTANTLYFGCRSASKDHHYGSEWTEYAERQKIAYRPAFSRDGPTGTKRVYVQDRIEQYAEETWELVGKAGAWVFISGSSNKMPTAVKNAIKAAAEIYGGYSADDASRYIEDMIQEGRLIEECWS
ncbi:hypothetical protein AMATHDRAFT_82115 [Amanita thiersii Skay4041]|uniref:NADPH-dependent diflavin oxidoreductase 1 n=1 Tax=Amanita thiersii Skay4041 TaxID=703135 RepID=A0A2A9NIT6_9AGAR|nr:hypothetical protein AMATHDRAFT_82115 [Amanita thiersii Skay4041]